MVLSPASLRETAIHVIDAAAFLIEVVGVAIIVFAVGWAVVRWLAALPRHRDAIPDIRLLFIERIIFALDLFVAADLLETVGAPRWTELGMVAATIAIRIVLTLALEQELRRDRRERKEQGA